MHDPREFTQVMPQTIQVSFFHDALSKALVCDIAKDARKAMMYHQLASMMEGIIDQRTYLVSGIDIGQFDDSFNQAMAR